MKLRRGFKSEAEAIALDLRRQVGASVREAVDVFEIAKRFEASVVALGELRAHGAKAQSIRHFQKVEPNAFSALTVMLEGQATIIYNDAHTRGRIANSVAHETSHIVLKHQRPSGVVAGCRQWDGNQEGEADWLAGCVLVPRPAATWVIASKMPLGEAAAHFGVSEPLMRMRLNMTGAAKLATRRG